MFGADLRSLAALRIVLALLALVDVLSRAANLTAHYTDDGVLPRWVLLRDLPSRWNFSLHLMSGDAVAQAILFLLAGLAALALLVGWKTRAMTFVVWVLLMSVQARNPLVLSAADILLRLLFFWGLFLPLGARWSVDAGRSASPRRLRTQFVSLATVALFLQIAFVYWFGALHKSGPEWRTDHTAIYYALSLDQLVTPLGAYLRQFPTLMRLMTLGVFWFEALAPLLLFSPVRTGLLRTAAVVGFISLHLGIRLTMDLGLFQWVAALCMVCFLPPSFWENVAKAMTRVTSRPPVAVRRLQQSMARLSPARLSPFPPRLLSPLAAHQARYSAQPAPDPFAPRRTGPWWLGWQRAMPAGGAPTGTASPDLSVAPGVEGTPEELRSSAGTNLVVGFFLACAFSWNLSTVPQFQFRVPPAVEPIAVLLGLDQSWDMFSPYPSTEDGWFVIPASLQGGQRLDLFPAVQGDYSVREGVTWEKPRSVASTFRERGWRESWRKYLLRIWEARHSEQRLYFGQYLCREWNARHEGPEQLERFEIYYMLERTQPNYRGAEPERQLLWRHSCS